MKIKFNSDGELPRNKMIKIPTIAIILSAAYNENNKYHPQVFLGKFLCK